MHSHISKVKEWGFTKDHDFKVTLWGCVLCDETSPVVFPGDEEVSIDHTDCDENCFGCKAKGLQLNTGDTTRDMPDKKWTGELQAYRDARAQGIQPAGTTMRHIEAAHKASETMGRAYDADKMPQAHTINSKSAEVMKELGV
jgi:hypothetical protein